MQRILSSSIFCLALVATPATAAMQKEPAGVGKANLGMTPAEVEKLYAGAVRPLGTEHLGATPVQSPNISRQLLADQKLPGLPKPTNVELRYWKDKLWVIIVYFGGNSSEEVEQALRDQLGPPDLAGADSIWRGKKVQVNTAHRERWYAVADVALSAEAQKAFAEDMQRAQERLRGARGGTAATPAPN